MNYKELALGLTKQLADGIKQDILNKEEDRGDSHDMEIADRRGLDDPMGQGKQDRMDWEEGREERGEQDRMSMYDGGYDE